MGETEGDICRIIGRCCSIAAGGMISISLRLTLGPICGGICAALRTSDEESEHSLKVRTAEDTMGAGQAPPEVLEGGQGSKGGEEERERADPSDESIGTAAAAAPTVEGDEGDEAPQGEEQKEDTILFIGDLARGLTEEDLEQAFSIVGKVCVCPHSLDPITDLPGHFPTP